MDFAAFRHSLPGAKRRRQALFAAALLAIAAAAPTAGSEPDLASATETALAAAAEAVSPAELEAARDALLELSRRYPRDLYPRFTGRSRALVEAAALGRRIGAGNASAGELLQVLEREAENEWTPRAHLELAEIVLANGDWRLAADHLWQARQGALSRESERPGEDRFAVDVASIALERMTRIHRLILRPLAGHSPWTDTRAYLPSGYLPDKMKLKKPRSVAAGPRGELLVADARRVVLFDPERNVTTTREVRSTSRPSLGRSGPLGGMHGVLGAGATALLTDRPNTMSFQKPSGGKLAELVALHRDPYGAWTVLSRAVDVVLRYGADGRQFDYSPATLKRPVDLAVGATGLVHVLDAGARSFPAALLTFTADWQPQQTVTGAWKRPSAVDVDPLGNSYVLDEGSRRIFVYGPDGVEKHVLGPTLPGGIELRTPTDIAVDGMGRIFIAEGRLDNVLAVE